MRPYHLGPLYEETFVAPVMRRLPTWVSEKEPLGFIAMRSSGVPPAMQETSVATGYAGDDQRSFSFIFLSPKHKVR